MRKVTVVASSSLPHGEFAATLRRSFSVFSVHFFVICGKVPTSSEPSCRKGPPPPPAAPLLLIEFRLHIKH